MRKRSAGVASAPALDVQPTFTELVRDDARYHVLTFLRKRGLIDEERVQLLLSWRHTGFSVYNSVVVEPEDPAAVERLTRYVMRSPVALDRIEYDEAAGMVEIRSRPRSDDEPDGQAAERVDEDELVARVIAQVPDPRRHLIRAGSSMSTRAARSSPRCASCWSRFLQRGEATSFATRKSCRKRCAPR